MNCRIMSPVQWQPAKQRALDMLIGDWVLCAGEDLTDDEDLVEATHFMHNHYFNQMMPF